MAIGLVNYAKFNPQGLPRGGRYAPQQGAPQLVDWNKYGPGNYGKPPRITNPVLTTTSGGGGAAGGGGVPPVNPNAGLDATYWANVNRNTLDTGNKITGLNTQNAQNLAAMQQALGDIAFKEPRDLLATENAAAARGALQSTVYAQDAADVATGYGTQADRAAGTYGAQYQDLINQIAGLYDEEGAFNTQEALASAGRLSQLAANNPAAAVPKTPKQQPNPAAQALARRLATGRVPTGGGH